MAKYSSLRRHWPDASGPQIVKGPLLKIGGKALIIYGLYYSLEILLIDI